MLCGTDNITWNIPHIRTNMKKYLEILSVPQNTVMDLNNVMMMPHLLCCLCLGELQHRGRPNIARRDIWGESIKILLFPSPTGHMLTSHLSGFLYWFEVCSIDSSQMISYLPQVLKFQPVDSETQPVHVYHNWQLVLPSLRPKLWRMRHRWAPKHCHTRHGCFAL